METHSRRESADIEGLGGGVESAQQTSPGGICQRPEPQIPVLFDATARGDALFYTTNRVKTVIAGSKGLSTLLPEWREELVG